MNTERFSVRFRPGMSDKAKARCRELHFRDRSAYLRYLVLWDLMHSRTDAWLLAAANAKPNVREQLLAAFYKLPADLAELAKVLRRL